MGATYHYLIATLRVSRISSVPLRGRVFVLRLQAWFRAKLITVSTIHVNILAYYGAKSRNGNQQDGCNKRCGCSTCVRARQQVRVRLEGHVGISARLGGTDTSLDRG